ncbi:MAG: 4Fe-4S dicluster domain-containing protein [Clostridium sp.]
MSASLGREEAKEAYGKLSKGGMDCMACRRCEKECPQHISISEQMKAVSKYFDK